MKLWQDTLLPHDGSIRDAIATIDRGGMQLALVVDGDRKLLGTITDGDVRRAILAGAALEAPAVSVMNRRPTTTSREAGRDASLALMKATSVRQLPVLNSFGQVVGIETIDDLVREQRRDNWVVLMAGGLGQRLRPLTDDIPKPLLNVGGRPLLETILQSFVGEGFHRFFISINYKATMIEQHFGDGSRWGAEISYLREDQRLGTAGALGLLPERPTEPLILMNGDLLTAVKFASILSFHGQQNAAVTMGVRQYTFNIPYGIADIDDHSNVVKLAEKPAISRFINAGIYGVSPDVVAQVEPGVQLDMPTLIERLLKQNRRVSAFPIREYWLDIGQMDDYKRAGEEYASVFK